FVHPPDLYPFPTRRSSDLCTISKREYLASDSTLSVVTRDFSTRWESKSRTSCLGTSASAQTVSAASRLKPPANIEILRNKNRSRSEEHTSELQSRENLVCR